ncbi:DUF916 domain-containing protein [Actinomadura graeca]|uniref:DUF916 domain-containing protein n=1 Tax=Actinomadura graeca TaxID=2750812 RepID=A0ABX8QUB7_9ACTN|nr:DUF916 domain-containing protein [Actinomadura graeca]QXJ22337.1 DUF916 domain-containing protein [Actinomadura graeca]
MNAKRGAAVVAAVTALAASTAVPVPASAHAGAAPVAAGGIPRGAARGAAPSPDGFAWSVKPAGAKGQSRRDFFVYAVSPGQQVRDKVVVTNMSTRKLTFRVYATDAFNTADGSFALLAADRTATDVGTWISVAGAPARTVAPGRSAGLPFTLTVPPGATPGDHSGGVIAAVTEQTTGGQGQRVNVDRRIAARVYARVDGALTSSLRVEGLKAAHDRPLFGGGDVDVTYRIRNTGNVRLAATARAGVSGPFGTGLGSPATRRVPELLPGNVYTFTDRVRGVYPAGPLTATLRLTPAAAADGPSGGSPAGARPTVRTTGWWATPWAPLAGVVFAVVLAAYLVRRRRRARA